MAEGQIVISDRYYYSTEAFQGFGRQLDRKLVSSINAIAIDSLVPDAVILLDLDPAEGINRNRSENSGKSERDAFEDEKIAFHTRLREGFLSLAEELPEPFLVINAGQSAEEVFNETIPLLDNLILAMET